MHSLVIVQPWFSANGHPAQTLINTARVLEQSSEIEYLIATTKEAKSKSIIRNRLHELCDVVEYSVLTASVREGTIRSLVALRRLIASESTIDRILFLDVHLVLLMILWPFFSIKKIKSLGMLYVNGPERITQFRVLKLLAKIFFARKEVILFVRTEELSTAWKTAFPGANIKYLPSLEIPNNTIIRTASLTKKCEIKFGVLGQIRIGKSLEWLVPLFKNKLCQGKLTVAGTFYSDYERTKLAVLHDFDGFVDKFLTEEELLEYAASQDYLLMLYDNWDHRMEAAMMFVAARSNRPVIVYDKGWCGRMVKTFGNGIFAPTDSSEFPEFIDNLPKSDSLAYQQLLDGVNAFRIAHSGDSIRNIFIKTIWS